MGSFKTPRPLGQAFCNVRCLVSRIYTNNDPSAPCLRSLSPATRDLGRHHRHSRRHARSKKLPSSRSRKAGSGYYMTVFSDREEQRWTRNTTESHTMQNSSSTKSGTATAAIMGRRESMNTCPASISHISSTCQKTKSLTTVSTAAQNNSGLELTDQENTDSTLK